MEEESAGVVSEFVDDEVEVVVVDQAMEAEFTEIVRRVNAWFDLKVGRNDPCYCGSEKKFKKCCHGTRLTKFLQSCPPGRRPLLEVGEPGVRLFYK